MLPVVRDAAPTFDHQSRSMPGVLKEPRTLAERKTSEFRCPYVALSHQPIFTQGDEAALLGAEDDDNTSSEKRLCLRHQRDGVQHFGNRFGGLEHRHSFGRYGN